MIRSIKRLTSSRFLLRQAGFVRPRSKTERSQAGFTLFEMLVVVIMIAVIAAIAAPGWLGYLDRRRLATAQDTLYQALVSSQVKAQQTASRRGVAIRDNGGTVEWALFAGDSTTASGWEALDSSIVIDTTSITLTPDADGAYFIAFNYRGNLTDALDVGDGFILTTQSAVDTGSGMNRGVVVETLLGSLRRTQ